MIILPILTILLINFSLKGWENVLFELGSERVKKKPDQVNTERQLSGNVRSILGILLPNL